MINHVILVGFVGNDPEVRKLENGLTVANFSLATTEKWKDKEGKKQEATEWHRVVVWRGLAEVTEKYVRKGSQLYIEGKMKTRKYDDKDEVTHYITEVFADTLKLLGKRDGESRSSDAKFEEQGKAITGAMSDINELPGTNENIDDLPF